MPTNLQGHRGLPIFHPSHSSGAFWIIASLPAIIALFGSRWVSQIPVGPVFLLDPFLVVSSLLLIAAVGNPVRWTRRTTTVFLALMLLPAWAIVRTPWNNLTVDALRDLYPYVVLIYAALLAAVLSEKTEANLKPLGKVLQLTLVLHWIWVSLFRWFPGWRDWLPEGFLSPRGDIDGTLIGVLAGVVFLKSSRSTRPVRWLGFLITILLISQVSFMSSRAALIASLAIVITLVGVEVARQRGEGERGKILTPIVPGVAVVVISLGIALFWAPAVGPKLVGGYQSVMEAFAPDATETDSTTPPESVRLNSGLEERFENEAQILSLPEPNAGTTNARIAAWTTVTEYVFDSPSRIVAGAGVGSNYFRESGGLAALIQPLPKEGPDPTRHPHNVVIHTAGLLGVPATLMLVSIFGWGFSRNAISITLGPEMTKEIALAVLVGLGVASLFGVIFEGPYGVVPLAWSLGISIALKRGSL